MTGPDFLAFDLGADSGRTMLGSLRKGTLALTELNRFPNRMVDMRGTLYWNLPALFEEMKNGLRICASKKIRPQSLAVDTWGVDFGLLDRAGSLLGLPVTYRDSRTNNIPEEFFRLVPKEKVYRLTGIQILQFNTLFQLFSLARSRSPLLDAAESLLFMADVFGYLFSGVKKSEFTFSTTSQLYNPVSKAWEDSLFHAMGVSKSIMQEIVLPGTILGELDSRICNETGVGRMPVVSCASHDTASAIAAIPAQGSDWAYISSGTWSLMGVESSKPIITEKSYAYNFTNEGGVEGTYRVLKNITGLWLMQRCRRDWAKKKIYSYDQLTALAKAATPFKCCINPDSNDFLNPADMPAAIAGFCKSTGQKPPKTAGETVRCSLESLAFKYRETLAQLRELYGTPINRLHVIGGGTRNKLLCQYTANACGIPVIAGPVEATASGNILMQAKALGSVSTLAEIRSIVSRSCKPLTYMPKDTAAWDDAYERFLKMKATNAP